MLFYIRCPSCSRLISQNLDKYFMDLNDIKDDPALSKSDKEEKSSKLLDKYGFTMICCRIRIMGLIPYHEVINT
jgi:DNA-directed RNA polymerase subunit N (RpoN/RPB10)